MSNVNHQFKELINEAVDNCYHNNIEMKIILKDWLHGMCEQVDEESELRKQNGILSGQLDTLKINSDYYKKKATEHEAKAKAFDEGLEAVHNRLQHILHNTDTGKLLPGYVDGMYNSLDIINDCYESGEAE